MDLILLFEVIHTTIIFYKVLWKPMSVYLKHLTCCVSLEIFDSNMDSISIIYRQCHACNPRRRCTGKEHHGISYVLFPLG
jgi:hypothetical protein